MKIVVISGAGISAESGIKTFRDSNGLWENHNVEEVASPEGFEENPHLVLEFYNQRRRQLLTVEPNLAHIELARLEEKHEVVIITQNVDNLHERAGSTNVIHLHGELLKSRDTVNLIEYPQLTDLVVGDLSPHGNQLRPHIVWFGENVPLIKPASKEVMSADVVLVVGTSFNVYPAADLARYARVKPIVIDPSQPDTDLKYRFMQGTATEQVPLFVKELM